MTKRRRAVATLASFVLAGMMIATVATSSIAPAEAATVISPDAPIEKVVIFFQENHAFDNVLGLLCIQDNRCDAVDTAKLSTGADYKLPQAADIIPNVSHSAKSQNKAINGGRMDRFDKIVGCTEAKNYQCLTQYTPEQIPNLAALARKYVIHDRTFQPSRVLSWGAHYELIATELNGYLGENPKRVAYAPKDRSHMWGCNGNKVGGWRPSPGAPVQDVPACVPFDDGTGTFWDIYGPGGSPQPSPVESADTIFESMNNAGKSWKTYVTQRGFDICSYIAACYHSEQYQTNVVPTIKILDDAAAGTLPNLSIVLPSGPGGNTSQHNNASMKIGDNWIGQAVDALLKGPDANKTAIFITYDDCGCFYDHEPPPNSQWGMRMPMVIVSPWAKKGYTDSTTTNFIGMITFVEHLFGLPPLSEVDANAYDYANSFDFTQTPSAPRFRPKTSKLSKAEQHKLANVKLDPNDPHDAIIEFEEQQED